jgi:diguanylate cyclase (GGDEF)-like protein/PAS domain S-box-containing protein
MRETERLAELENLRAVSSEEDRVLQEIVDDLRAVFEVDLCMVNLVLSEYQYFRAWSGELPGGLAASRWSPRESSVCRHVVETGRPLVVGDMLDSGEFREHSFRTEHGIRFYAGTPLTTSGGYTLGTICLLGREPQTFGERDLALLSAFGRAAVGRLEALGALNRERSALTPEQEDRLNVFELANDAIIIYDATTRAILEVNGRACEIYGFDRHEFVGMNIRRLSLEPERGRKYLKELLARGSYRGFETVHRRACGVPMNVLISSSVVEFRGRRAVLSINRDITGRKQTEHRLREAEARYRTLVEQIPAITYIQDAGGEKAIRYLSPQFEWILGYPPEEAMADPKHWEKTLHPEDRDRVLAEDARTDATGEPFSVEYRRYCRDGRVLWMREESVLVRDEEGEPLFWHGVLFDITERKALEEELAYLASHDSLTGLPNRRLAFESLEDALERSAKTGGEVSLLFMDVDNFKRVNDSLGHTAGDRLLVGFSRRLRSGAEGCLVSRLGGDEFTVLIEDTREQDPERLAGRILRELREPFDLDGREVPATTSIGIASGSAGDAASDLLRRADAAMYRAKREGKNRYKVFERLSQTRPGASR